MEMLICFCTSSSVGGAPELQWAVPGSIYEDQVAKGVYSYMWLLIIKIYVPLGDCYSEPKDHLKSWKNMMGSNVNVFLAPSADANV